MQDTLAFLRTSRPLRYIFIGGISYVIEVVVLLVLTNIVLLSSTLSVALSFWFGLVASFALQKYAAFRNNKNDKRTLGKQSLAYGALVLFNFLFTTAVIALFAGDADSIKLVVVRTAVLILTTFWNYLVYKKIFA